jgi:hypothetical protein
MAINIGLEYNVVVSADGLLDESGKSGFNGTTFPQLVAEPQNGVAYHGPKPSDSLLGEIMLSAEPSITMYRYTP